MGTLKRVRLSNGITLLFSKNPAFKAASVFSHVAVGSGASSDPVGKKGLAHVIEHVVYRILAEVKPMFGPTLLAAADARRVIYPQAKTELDFTHYSIVAPLECLGETTEFLAKWLSSPLLTDSHVARCVKEVEQEKNFKTQQSPFTEAYDELYELGFSGHPYSAFTVGKFKDLATIELKDVAEFHRQHYRASNFTFSFVFSGDIAPEAYEKFIGQITDFFEKIPSDKKTQRSNLRFDSVRGEFDCKIQKTKHAQSSFLAGILLPEIGHEAAQILMQALVSPASGLMTQLKSQVAMGAGYIPQLRNAHFMELMFAPRAPTSDFALAICETFLEEMQRLQSGGLSGEEIKRAQETCVLDWQRMQTSPMSLGENLVSFETVGVGAEFWNDFPERVSAVTEEAIHRAGTMIADPKRLRVVSTFPALTAAKSN
jgi:zinc protease